MSVPQSDPVLERARTLLRSYQAPAAEVKALVLELKRRKRFHLAQRLLTRARRSECDDPALRLWLGQQHALCTYKDPDLPWSTRLERAAEILQETDSLATTRNQETLGIAGAIAKARWQRDGRKEHLERSLAYYLRGYRVNPVSEAGGYTGINAAYVLDLLAFEEAEEAIRAGTRSDVAERRRDDARRIREHLVEQLPLLLERPGGDGLRQNWWFLVTLAEAHFGLADYGGARPWLALAKRLDEVPEWEYESTVKQLASLARLQSAANGNAGAGVEAWAWDVLIDFLGSNFAAVQTAFNGKVGLALSGGGFRASLFHIGVLARLAELDVLRHVEVLSCVSGGSILGAHYYLEVRKLLEEKRDDEITREHYVEIVRRLAREFLAGVQENIRMRVVADPIVNLRMIFQRSYSRTQRAGELMESLIYSRVEDGHPAREPRYLSGLYVQPRDAPRPFRPKDHNWRRRNKVPVLVLNATTLNTGHNWQFTASWMGEPPTTISSEVDGNYRLRRMYYDDDAPEPFRKIRLGHAVAASACVPGLFEPLVLPGLYEREAPSAAGGVAEKAKEPLTVRLVDGGVHDNQGVASLLEQDCNVLLVSDASGQMTSQDHPSAGLLGVPLRSNDILMARVREAQYAELASRRGSGLLRGLMFVHLKKDLDVDTVNWAGCEEPYDPADEALTAARRGPTTRYGIPKRVQEQLAAIRTDLDSFCDAEAFALMTSGYRMTEWEIPRTIDGLAVPAEEPRERWGFLSVESALQGARGLEAAHGRVAAILEAAQHRALKIWRLSRPLRLAGLALGVVLAAGVLVLLYREWSRSLLTVGGLGTTLLAAAGAMLVGSTVVRLVRWRKTLAEVAIGVGLALLGWLVARVHLHVFDRRYLKFGRLDLHTDLEPAPAAVAPAPAVAGAGNIPAGSA